MKQDQHIKNISAVNQAIKTPFLFRKFIVFLRKIALVVSFPAVILGMRLQQPEI